MIDEIEKLHDEIRQLTSIKDEDYSDVIALLWNEYLELNKE